MYIIIVGFTRNKQAPELFNSITERCLSSLWELNAWKFQVNGKTLDSTYSFIRWLGAISWSMCRAVSIKKLLLNVCRYHILGFHYRYFLTLVTSTSALPSSFCGDGLCFVVTKSTVYKSFRKMALLLLIFRCQTLLGCQLLIIAALLQWSWVTHGWFYIVITAWSGHFIIQKFGFTSFHVQRLLVLATSVVLLQI